MRDITVTPHLTIPASELAIAFARSGGPGGQNVNKVSSKVELRWNLRDTSAASATDHAQLLEKLGGKLTTEGELIVTSTKTRDQIKNRDDAFDKLTLIVRAALHRDKPRKATKPSKASKRRRVEGKRHRSEIKKGRRADY
jgi:ribosome-associated protein